MAQPKQQSQLPNPAATAQLFRDRADETSCVNTNVYQRLDQILAAVEGLRKQVAALEARVDSRLKTEENRIYNHVPHMESQMNSLVTQVNNRFANMDAQINDLNKRFDKQSRVT